MIKFKTTPEAVWISADHPIFDQSEIGSFPKEEREKVRFKIFPLTVKLLQELKAKHSRGAKYVLLNSADNKESDEDIFESPEYRRDLVDKILLDWEGVPDEQGKGLECSSKNKIALFEGGYPGLGLCVVKAARLIMSRFDELREQSEKNLETSQSGFDDVV